MLINPRKLLTVAALLALWPVHARAEDGIRSFVDANGKLVITNMGGDNAEPAQPTLGPSAPKAQPVTAPHFEIMGPIQALVNSISVNYGVDPELVAAIVKTESNFNRWAVSSKGARGLMQLVPETGHRFGVRDFFDPRQNIEGGVRYLRFLLDKFENNVELSLAAYNAGESIVQKLGRVPPIPETQEYVRKIRKLYKGPSGNGVSAKVVPVAAKPPVGPAALTTPTSPAAPAPPVPASPVASAAPVTPVAPVGPARTAEAEAAPADPAPATAPISKTIDARGVVHFSNIEH